MNPYAVYLGNRDPHEVLETTPERISALTAGRSDDILERRPAPKRWSIRDIVCHLADTEIVFAFRLRQSMAEAHHVIQPFDQDGWALCYEAYAVRDGVAAFAAIRAWNRRFLAAVPQHEMDHPLTHPERGTMTFRVLVETMAGHDLNHLRQIEALAAT